MKLEKNGKVGFSASRHIQNSAEIGFNYFNVNQHFKNSWQKILVSRVQSLVYRKTGHEVFSIKLLMNLIVFLIFSLLYFSVPEFGLFSSCCRFSTKFSILSFNSLNSLSIVILNHVSESFTIWILCGVFLQPVVFLFF